MNKTREVRESISVKIYPRPDRHLIVSRGMQDDPLRRDGRKQASRFALRLIAVDDSILSYNRDPHDLKLIVEPKLPRPRIVLQFELDQVTFSAF